MIKKTNACFIPIKKRSTRARVYIDDKGIRFTDWETALQAMEKLGIIEK